MTDQLQHTVSMEVTRIIAEAPGVKSFVLQPLDGEIQYKPGQFLTFLFKRRSGQEARRSYSMSSSPELNEPITITVKRVPNGEFSRILLDRLKTGEVLHTIGASGFFVLPEHLGDFQRYVFFAAGSGITPVFSLVKTLLHRYPEAKVLLLYSNTSAVSIFFDQLVDLEKRYAQLEVVFLFSDAKDLSKSRLSPALIDVLFHNYQITDFDKTLFYVCGPGGYMRMVWFHLLTLGVSIQHIRREIFHIQHPEIRPAPSDTARHVVRLIAANKEYVFSVQYPVTILQAAKLVNAPIPYSCENGQCGSCVAKCLHGTVWMAGNEVLLDEEIAMGKILTCTGFPVKGDVTLII